MCSFWRKTHPLFEENSAKNSKKVNLDKDFT